MGKLESKTNARLRRKKRIRKKIRGTAERPRLCVFRSSKHIYAQVIDDTTGNTLASAGSVEKSIKDLVSKVEGKIAKAELIGKTIAERALEKGVKKVVFDRSGFLYHGRVKALSDGARKAGLSF